MLLRHPKDKQTLCHIHRSRVVQLGSCLTCPNRATICEVKGCISHHEENERAHNVLTLEQIRLIVSQYLNSATEKRAYLKKMVYQYFTIARKEVERLFTQVHDSIDHFVFDDLIFQEDDRRLIAALIDEEYEEFTCEQIAVIIPKLIKSYDYEDGHFTHLRNYLIAEKEKVVTSLGLTLLNLPEFRWKDPAENAYRFYEIYEETLKELNTKISNLTHHPKKIRLKYIDVLLSLFRMITILTKKNYSRSCQPLQRFQGTFKQLKFIAWDVDDSDYQLAVVDSLIKLPYLRTISIYTSYQVTSTEFLEELIQNRNDVEIKVYKKAWIF